MPESFQAKTISAKIVIVFDSVFTSTMSVIITHVSNIAGKGSGGTLFRYIRPVLQSVILSLASLQESNFKEFEPRTTKAQMEII
jgi:hypothetical protein